MTDCELVKYLSEGFKVREIAHMQSVNIRTLEKRLEILKDRALCKSYGHLVGTYLRKKLIE